MLKTDENGDTIWTKTFGDDGESAQDIIQADDEGFLIVGNTYDQQTGDHNYLIIKTDQNGDSLWAKISTVPLYDYAYKILKAGNNEYLIQGTVYRSSQWQEPAPFINKINSNGDSIWPFIYTGQYAGTIADIKAYGNGEYIMVGSAYVSGHYDDIWFLKFDEYTFIDENDNLWPARLTLNSIYPNPFNLSTVIEYSVPGSGSVKINIYNALGQAVHEYQESRKSAGKYSYIWNTFGLASGVYFINVNSGAENVSSRAILLK